MNSIINFDASFSHHVMAPYSRFHDYPKLPVIIYKQVLQLGDSGEKEVKQLFESNGWTNAWTDGVFKHPHYHTTAHEVLAVIDGDCMLELAGPDGTLQKITKGDIVLLPAGVVHKNAGSSENFTVVGAYPQGQEQDMNHGLDEDAGKIEEKVKNVKIPRKDPVFGDKGPVAEFWTRTITEGDTVIKKDRQF